MLFLSCLQASRTTQKLALSFFEQDYLNYVVFLLLFCCPQYLPVASCTQGLLFRSCFQLSASDSLWQPPAASCQPVAAASNQLSACGSCLLPYVSLWQQSSTSCQLGIWQLPMLPAVIHQMLYVPTLRRICQGRNKVLRMSGTMCQFCVYSDYTVK